jgi:hypothetical protein
MKVKALTNIGGVLKAHAGEEFELTNEAQLQDLLQQGVIVPVQSNPQEVAKAMNLSGEQLHEARTKQVQERTLEEKAYAEAVQVANNKKSAERQQKEAEEYKKAMQQAEQRVQSQFKSEQNVQEAQHKAEQTRLQAEQQRATANAEARYQSNNQNQNNQ